MSTHLVISSRLTPWNYVLYNNPKPVSAIPCNDDIACLMFSEKYWRREEFKCHHTEWLLQMSEKQWDERRRSTFGKQSQRICNSSDKEENIWKCKQTKNVKFDGCWKQSSKWLYIHSTHPPTQFNTKQDRLKTCFKDWNIIGYEMRPVK